MAEITDTSKPEKRIRQAKTKEQRAQEALDRAEKRVQRADRIRKDLETQMFLAQREYDVALKDRDYAAQSPYLNPVQKPSPIQDTLS